MVTEPSGSVQFSGRYTYSSKLSTNQLTASRLDPDSALRAFQDRGAPDAIPSASGLSWFTLHVDIDGANPLNVVSGVFGKGEPVDAPAQIHFIGRVRANEPTATGLSLVVEDVDVAWPGSNARISRLTLSVHHSASRGTWAEVIFHDTLQELSFGPFDAIQESLWFREVEMDVAVETGAATVEPYDTHTHPDRPAKLPRERMTIESAFAKAGIRMIRSPKSGYIVDTSEAREDGRWSTLELHDSMQLHWDAFADNPQWKLWLFVACLSEHEHMGGTMFDCVGRKGVAIFTRCPYFYSTEGGYIVMNPPVEAAVKRELFFNTIHEMGHAFNLAHPSERTEGKPWKTPVWMRGRSSKHVVTWMNYPDLPTRYIAGANATWFYKRFTFQFDKHELLFLRHAPDHFVAMGGKPSYQNRGRVALGSIDCPLRLSLRTGKNTYELAEPIVVEIQLSNVSDQSVLVHRNLDPSDGMVELSVIDPDGLENCHVPMIRNRSHLDTLMLEPGSALPSVSVRMTVGAQGSSFKRPGAYRVEARYTDLDGGTTAAAIQFDVRPPADPDVAPVVNELFNDRVGQVLCVGGTRVMQDVNDKLDWVLDRLGMRHPISMHLTAVRYTPMMQSTKLIVPGESRVQTLDPEPDAVVEHLAEVVIEQSHMAAQTMGHIYFQEVVDAFTRAAMKTGAQRLALQAQERLVGLFKSRDTPPSIAAAAESRMVQLRHAQ
jgi:hypothetical protein